MPIAPRLRGWRTRLIVPLHKSLLLPVIAVNEGRIAEQDYMKLLPRATRQLPPQEARESGAVRRGTQAAAPPHSSCGGVVPRKWQERKPRERKPGRSGSVEIPC